MKKDVEALTEEAAAQDHLKLGLLTERDHLNLSAFLGAVLDAYRDGRTSRVDAIDTLGHVFGAVDAGNLEEARTWFEQGRKLITQQGR